MSRVSGGASLALSEAVDLLFESGESKAKTIIGCGR
jgi:hypothetical protein